MQYFEDVRVTGNKLLAAKTANLLVQLFIKNYFNWCFIALPTLGNVYYSWRQYMLVRGVFTVMYHQATNNLNKVAMGQGSDLFKVISL